MPGMDAIYILLLGIGWFVFLVLVFIQNKKLDWDDMIIKEDKNGGGKGKD